MLVGLNGICVKSHGGTDSLGFAHAIESGVKLIRRNFNDVIKKDLDHLIAENINKPNDQKSESALA